MLSEQVGNQRQNQVHQHVLPLSGLLKLPVQIYARRFEKVPDCRDIDLAAIREKPRWLPKTCAYWLLDNGYDLPDWHPLITGRADSVSRAGMSLQAAPWYVKRK